MSTGSQTGQELSYEGRMSVCNSSVEVHHMDVVSNLWSCVTQSQQA